MLVVTIIFYIQAQSIEEDPFGVGMQPYVFPEAICYILGVITLLQIGQAALQLHKERGAPLDARELRLFVVWVVPMALIAFGYIGLINLFQYLLPTVVALSATLALFGNRGVRWLVTVPVISALFYYVIFFGVFRLLEPTGLLLDYDNYHLFGAMRKFIGL